MRSSNARQIDDLGKRLAKQVSPSEELLRELQALREEYSPALRQVEAVLRAELNLEPTSRPKTVPSIIDKLRREGTRLSTMQDIVGLRIVLTAKAQHLLEQDVLVLQIQKLLSCKVKDRRGGEARGRGGYRAVHLITTVEDCPVEIQVRTIGQHIWAEAAERCGDHFGKGLKYEAPTEEARGALNLLKYASRLIEEFELRDHAAVRMQVRLKDAKLPRALLREIRSAFYENRETLKKLSSVLLQIMKELGDRGE